MNTPVETPWTKPAKDFDTWQALLTLDVDDKTLAWMMHRLMNDFEPEGVTRTQLWTSFLRSDIPLDDAQLACLMRGDGAPDNMSVALVRNHPAAGLATIAAMLDDALTVIGTVRHDRAGLPDRYAAWLYDRRSTAFISCRDDPREWVRAMAASRRQGITHWHPDWESEKGLLRGHGRAQRLWLAGMRSLETTGDPTMWKALIALTEHTKLGPNEVQALIASTA